MDQEIDQLIERANRLLEITRQLAQENAALRAQLAQAQGAQTELQERMREARSRVELALARLPALAPQEH